MKDRAVSILKRCVSEFINRESNRTSMITVTNVALDERKNKADVFISVYPEKDTRAAVEFLNRNRDELKRYFKGASKLQRIPRIQFLPDPIIGGTITPVEKSE